jgi:hypothetical protein
MFELHAAKPPPSAHIFLQPISVSTSVSEGSNHGLGGSAANRRRE